MKAQPPRLIVRQASDPSDMTFRRNPGKEKEYRQVMKTGRSQLQVKEVDAQSGNSVKAQISEVAPSTRVRFRTKGATGSSGMRGWSSPASGLGIQQPGGTWIQIQ